MFKIDQKVELMLPSAIKQLGGETKLRAYWAHSGSYQLTLSANKEIHLSIDLK